MERLDPPIGGEPLRPIVLDDYRALARTLLPAAVFDYIDSGAGDEVTCRVNRRDLDGLMLVPLCMRDVSAPTLTMDVLGRSFRVPIGFSPTAFHRLVHADGEIATANAAKALSVPMIVSSMSSVSLEEIAASSGHDDLWLQTYIFKDRGVTRELVARAECAGYKAIVVTLGCPVPGKRDRNLRSGSFASAGVTAANFSCTNWLALNDPIRAATGAELDPSLTWRDLAWLRQLTALPIIAKGVMNPRDVAPIIDMELAGVIVSNHGGRQLDTTASTISMLPEIAAAIAGRLPLFIDSGFRRGTDVLKALALGADGVFLGRPVVWALAAGGSVGVITAIELLVTELRIAMQLAGCPGVAEARRDAPQLLRRG
jgi:isopentenyl diphosphate isomerase/L-lactate dehydrogenase-like FMN-dependent dehydrogenase